MEIKIWSVGKTKFTADTEYQEPMIREAIDQCGDVASVITDYTDSERVGISHDEYARVTGDVPGLVLFEGWLTGDRGAPPPAPAQESHAAPLDEAREQRESCGKAITCMRSEAKTAAGRGRPDVAAAYRLCARLVAEAIGFADMRDLPEVEDV